MNTPHLVHGDILTAELGDVPPINLVVTSPPYNVGISYATHQDTMPYPEYLSWCLKWIQRLYDLVADDGRVCINVPMKITQPHDLTHNYPVAADYTDLFRKVGFSFYNMTIWHKGNINKTCWGSFGSASAPFIRDPAECILFFYKKQWARIDKDPGRAKSTITNDEFVKWTQNVWTFPAEKKSKHPAPFPLELPMRCINLLSYKDDVVCDPFMGSGTTGLACQKSGRRFVGVEISKEYYDLATTRLVATE